MSDNEFHPHGALCHTCKGTGVDAEFIDGWDDEGYPPCMNCNGTGYLESPFEGSGFWIETDSGHAGHILGNPDMPEETKRALRGLIDHVYKLLDDGWTPGKD
jgi:hypothetical protein